MKFVIRRRKEFSFLVDVFFFLSFDHVACLQIARTTWTEHAISTRRAHIRINAHIRGIEQANKSSKWQTMRKSTRNAKTWKMKKNMQKYLQINCVRESNMMFFFLLWNHFGRENAVKWQTSYQSTWNRLPRNRIDFCVKCTIRKG